MSMNPILAALAGGGVGLASSLGGGGGGGAMALSPLLALLMQHKHQGSQPVMAPGPVPPSGAGAQTASPLGGAPVMPQLGGPSLAKTAAQLPQVPSPGMDPAKRQQIAQMLLSYGGQMAGFRPQSY